MARGGLRGRARMDTAVNGLALESMARPATSQSLFGNDRPLAVEIGSGKGSFLVAQSLLRPEVNFLGIERALRFWRFGADRLRRRECANARFVRGDAHELVRDVLGLQAVSEFHIYFPDPWPKTKHHRRRLIQRDFLILLHKKLIDGGRLQIVTDHVGYFEHIEKVLKDSELVRVEFERPESAAAQEIAGTNFERKYLKEGRPFHAIAARKL